MYAMTGDQFLISGGKYIGTSIHEGYLKLQDINVPS